MKSWLKSGALDMRGRFGLAHVGWAAVLGVDVGRAHSRISLRKYAKDFGLVIVLGGLGVFAVTVTWSTPAYGQFTYL